MHFHFYADEESIALLASATRKAILVGGDFGYGNFGDVLQHLGSVEHVREASDLAVASVFMLDAVSRLNGPAALRASYGVDALLFATEVPIAGADARALGLRPVDLIRNIAFVHLYGGGYLNALWGESVLSVVEQFLRQLPGVPYVMSGQQLSAGFEQRTLAHVTAFQPLRVGMRDQASLARATATGIAADFSFDDAVEPLLGLGNRLQLHRGDGVFIHLNTSGYTGNDEALSEMAGHLHGIVDRLGDRGQPILLQTFQDVREEVVDTLETVKRLETAFPFPAAETVMLVRAILGEPPGEAKVLQGAFGYSSSYHVTLWLQLSGIPCWLRGSNAYYQEKRRALGVAGGFDAFLAQMPQPDHGENLYARARWRTGLQQVLGAVGYVDNRIQWSHPADDALAHSFHYKGEPRLAQQVEAVRQASARLDARLQASIEQISEIGSEARRYREASLQAHARLQEAERREREASSHLQEILGSRIWRWTQPLRAVARFTRTGRFDREGQVGLFGMAGIVGRKLPLPAHWRSAIGLRLRGLRRH